MKRKVKVLVMGGILLFSGINANAQVFEEGASFVSLGYGFPNLSGALFKIYKTNEGFKRNMFGPIHAKGEYAITDKLGIGLSINYTAAKATWDYSSSRFNSSTGNYEDVTYQEGWNTMSINTLIRLNWHFVDHDKVDFYSGFGLGYNYAKYEYINSDPDYTEDGTLTTLANIIPIGYEATIGLRYLFTENIGAYMELGWAKSIMQVGAVMKF